VEVTHEVASDASICARGYNRVAPYSLLIDKNLPAAAGDTSGPKLAQPTGPGLNRSRARQKTEVTGRISAEVREAFNEEVGSLWSVVCCQFLLCA
jgi:hypothetical protein